MKDTSTKQKTGLSRCMELASDKKGLIILSVVLSSLAAIASFIPYIAIYGIMKELIQIYPAFTNINVSSVISFAWMAMGGILANILLYFFALLCSHLAAFKTLYELKLYFAKHITNIPLGYHFTIGSGRMRKIMDENIESIEGFIAHQLPDFVASVTAPIVMIIILFVIDWRFGLVSLIGIIMAFVVQFMGYGGSAMKENMKKYQIALEDMSSASVEYIRGMSVVKAFSQSAGSFEKLKSAIENYVRFAISFSMGFRNSMPAFTTIVHNIYLLLIPLAIYLGQHTNDYLSFATTFIFYLIFVPSIAGILNKIMYVSESFMQINGNVARMDEILNIPENKETNNPKPIHNTSVTLEHISFSYDKEQSTLALDDISFKAPVGKLTAIVGPSGGGKSTIASLICRFYDVNQGQIKIGDTDIRDIPSATLMDTISFVFQDTFLFKTTIKENIRFGNLKASDEEIVQAAKLSQCHDFIMKLPKGYDTEIGAKGIYLSGGEKQRITIARAMIKNAPILVLDEASAFCDSENEHLIQKAFEHLMKDKTVIMIAHRLSTIRKAEQILVLEKGKLIEQGNHESLCKQHGRYAAMWESYTQSLAWKLQTQQEVQ